MLSIWKNTTRIQASCPTLSKDNITTPINTHSSVWNRQMSINNMIKRKKKAGNMVHKRALQSVMKELKKCWPGYCFGLCFLKLRQSAAAGWWLLFAGADLPAEESGPAQPVEKRNPHFTKNYKINNSVLFYCNFQAVVLFCWKKWKQNSRLSCRDAF